MIPSLIALLTSATAILLIHSANVITISAKLLNGSVCIRVCIYRVGLCFGCLECGSLAM